MRSLLSPPLRLVFAALLLLATGCQDDLTGLDPRERYALEQIFRGSALRWSCRPLSRSDDPLRIDSGPPS